jgi:hypothetical protein
VLSCFRLKSAAGLANSFTPRRIELECKVSAVHLFLNLDPRDNIYVIENNMLMAFPLIAGGSFRALINFKSPGW